MSDICTNVHFDSHICSVAYSAWTLLFLDDLTKPAITIAGVDNFTEIWHFVCFLGLSVLELFF